MRGRRTPTAVKKIQGTYNVTDDRDKDFVLVDGIIMATPVPPKDFGEIQTKQWRIVWRHLIAHEYGKAADVELVEMYVRCLYRWKAAVIDNEVNEAVKWHGQCHKCSEALGLNPAAMAKVAILQKKTSPKKEKIASLKDA